VAAGEGDPGVVAGEDVVASDDVGADPDGAAAAGSADKGADEEGSCAVVVWLVPRASLRPATY
jgi:hypothetical protein